MAKTKKDMSIRQSKGTENLEPKETERDETNTDKRQEEIDTQVKAQQKENIEMAQDEMELTKQQG